MTFDNLDMNHMKIGEYNKMFSSTIVLVPDHSLSLFFLRPVNFLKLSALFFFRVRWTWNSYLENLILYLVNKTRFGAQ